MAPVKNATPPPAKPAVGYNVVIGPRSVLAYYGGAPWADVLMAAELGRDGLRVDTEGSQTAEPAREEFKLRQMPIPCSDRARLGCSLMKQNW